MLFEFFSNGAGGASILKGAGGVKKAEFTPHCLLECSACMIPLNNVHGELSRPTEAKNAATILLDCFIEGVDCTL